MNIPRSACPPSGFCPWVSAQPQRKTLDSTALGHCCEKKQKQSQTNQILLRSDMSTKQGEKEGQCLGEPVGWMIQVPPAQLAQNLLPGGCRVDARGLWLPLGMLQCYQASPTKPALQALVKAKAVFGTRVDPSCPSGSPRDKLCSWPLISRSQWAVASSLGLAASPCVHLSGMVGRMGAGDTTFLSSSLGAGGMAPSPLHIKVYSAAKLE